MKTLFFLSNGNVELRESTGETLWTSDDDDEFAEFFGSDFPDASNGDDIDDITDYLIDIEQLEEDEEFDIEEQEDDGDDDDDDGDGDDDDDGGGDIIDGEFTDITGTTRQSIGSAKRRKPAKTY